MSQDGNFNSKSYIWITVFSQLVMVLFGVKYSFVHRIKKKNNNTETFTKNVASLLCKIPEFFFLVFRKHLEKDKLEHTHTQKEYLEIYEMFMKIKMSLCFPEISGKMSVNFENVSGFWLIRFLKFGVTGQKRKCLKNNWKVTENFRQRFFYFWQNIFNIFQTSNFIPWYQIINHSDRKLWNTFYKITIIDIIIEYWCYYILICIVGAKWYRCTEHNVKSKRNLKLLAY